MKAVLSDGTGVLIREIQASDKRSLALGLERLSPESRRRRFLTVKPRFSARELRYLTEVDGHDHYAIVAATTARPQVLVAVARFVRLSDPTAAEAAIVVCDELQGRRLGTALAERLADAALERGITTIEASILADNRPAHALMRTIAARLAAHGVHDGVQQVVAELPRRLPGAPSPPGARAA